MDDKKENHKVGAMEEKKENQKAGTTEDNKKEPLKLGEVAKDEKKEN